LNKNILMVTFNTEPWHLSVTVETIMKEIELKKKVTWFLLDYASLDNKVLPLSSNLRSREIRRLIHKLVKSDLRFKANVKIVDSVNLISEPHKDTKRSKEVARAELISRLRDSNPCLIHNLRALKQYSQIYLDLNRFFIDYLSKNTFEKAYVFNGRPLCERAFDDAASTRLQKVDYFETFNENWADRYFIFKKPTHSVSYRSKVMEKFSLSEEVKNSKKYKNISSSWFDQRIAGLTQSYTKHQMSSSELSRKKPYYVFFHSSQDELDMVGLTDSYWGNQMEILKILVRIFKAQSNYDLILRIHPHLKYKSQRDQNIWSKVGENLQTKYPWFTYFGPMNSVSSYDLVRQAHGVITSGSTIGVEAVYLKKSSILIGDAFHKYMGITINPTSIRELADLINHSTQITNSEKSFNAALRYGYFHSQGGLKFNFVQYNGKNQYSVKTFRISYSWCLRALRRLELRMASIIIKAKLRRCDCDNWIDSSARW